jgi:putative ABC transport system permease protein
MKYTLFIIGSALEDLRRNKIRTLLTSLGILIGVASVVLLIAFGLGLKAFITNQFNNLGTDLLFILPGQTFRNGSFRGPGQAMSAVNFDDRDIVALKRIKSLETVVPQFTKTVTANAEGNSESTDILITNEDIFPTRNLVTKYGRPFTKSDNQKRAKVIVVGPKIAEKLFGSAELALNRIVKLDNQGFRIIGVLESKGGGGLGGPDFDSYTYMPERSAISFNPDKKIISVIIKPKNADDLGKVKQDISTTMLKRYKEDDFSIAEQTEVLNAISSIFSALNGVLVAIAAISLVVGGIGIMNIMYVSVAERIREIGIRRALGALKNDILFQFLAEAITLSLFGCVLGVGFSFVITLIIQQFFPAYINAESVLIAVGVSSLIGILFGVFPAKKAADLSPIEAIRHE